jgi:hypothetical protein
MSTRLLTIQSAQTEVAGDGLDLDPTSSTGDDFLSREKAALGDDADLFASSNDDAVFAEPADDDLLGGGHDGEEVTEFESSFPEINTHNEVRSLD